MSLIPASEAQDMAYDLIRITIDDIAKDIKNRAKHGFFDIVVEYESIRDNYDYIINQLKDAGYTIIHMDNDNIRISWAEE